MMARSAWSRNWHSFHQYLLSSRFAAKSMSARKSRPQSPSPRLPHFHQVYGAQNLNPWNIRPIFSSTIIHLHQNIKIWYNCWEVRCLFLRRRWQPDHNWVTSSSHLPPMLLLCSFFILVFWNLAEQIHVSPSMTWQIAFVNPEKSILCRNSNAILPLRKSWWTQILHFLNCNCMCKNSSTHTHICSQQVARLFCTERLNATTCLFNS